MASAALYAEDKSVSATRLARAKTGSRQPLHVLLELATLVEAPHFLSPADVSASDEDPGKGHFGLLRLAQDPVELVREPGVHGQIALVDLNSEGAQDRSDGLAVLEGGPDDSQACEVHHYAFLRTRYMNFRVRYFRRRRRRLLIFPKWGLGKGAEKGLNAAGAVANGRLSGGIKGISATAASVVGE